MFLLVSTRLSDGNYLQFFHGYAIDIYVEMNLHSAKEDEQNPKNPGFIRVRENWKSQGKSENVFQSLESQGI